MGSIGSIRGLVTLAALALAGAAPAVAVAGPAPGSPEFLARDLQNVADAYGRITAPGGQLQNPNYLAQLVPSSTESHLAHLTNLAVNPLRPAITPGTVVPGWNMASPLRQGWEGKRGQRIAVRWTNRYGALIQGDVFAPLPGARDPYTGAKLKGPFPGVVITTGSVQGSNRMYWWLAQDLAERGYVVLTYDVQGQGASETLPHQDAANPDTPFCNPFAAAEEGEQNGCPGVPFQQESNFVTGTQDALSFFLATPPKPYRNTNAGATDVNAFNPLWKLLDRRRDRRTATPGRTTKVAIVGHSLGASAVSYVQGVDKRVAAVVALDKLSGAKDSIQQHDVTPVVPALGVQSEYGFTVQPYVLSGGGIAPAPSSPTEAPDPQREKRTGFDAWRKAGVDSMVIVPRASTHLEYTDIALALPASRYGQDLTSVYTQAWLDRYLKHRSAAPLLDTRMRYLEPVGKGEWEPVTLDRERLLSFYYCSAYAFGGRASEDVKGDVGC
jgi:dienelactone hydrolase